MIHTKNFFHSRLTASDRSSFSGFSTGTAAGTKKAAQHSKAAFRQPHIFHTNAISSLFCTFSLKNLLRTAGILAAAFLLGSLASRITNQILPASSRSVTEQDSYFGTATPRSESGASAGLAADLSVPSPEKSGISSGADSASLSDPSSELIQQAAANLFAPSAMKTISPGFSVADTNSAALDALLLPSSNWGLSFPNEGERPTGNASIEELSAYNAHYASNTDKKVIFLTFDAGYENGNTPAILEALKKHQVPATFFVVGNFLSTNPELVKQMLAEGHTVGNHTWSHPNMSRIASQEAFSKELSQVEDLYREITGQEMTRYYRPPQGIYSQSNLQMAKDLGYETFFWSLAYVDWYQDNQPTKEQAFDKLLKRIHPGAIVLLHSTSSTNAQILDELLTRWEEMDYTFKPLSEVVS